ncbi:MAG: magnesium chelatase [Streptosporangiaceae bacterium]|nr:magnesium chelatase [Streptosporangiaceae bacterium]MBV9856973.1 magnesium chelatase [Streptosporangiaceae bacterium]
MQRNSQQPSRARHSRPPGASTLAELRASGHVYRSVKEEIRENLLARMRAGQDRFPGIVGFGQTVLPHVERALVAGHDIILLGERGQGKTRLARTLAGLLDEWSPAVAGCEINDHPYVPVCARCQRLAAEMGEDLPVTWRPARERYGEKLATPDTSVGDLIGDIDPVKVAEGRTLGDPETIHFGLVPRTNRGIFCVNELPDLAERIQVALLNVLEERDIGVRGYALRLPLDIVLTASANPEDYTNRGRIITPLKDRFGAEIRTHYPLSLEDELALIRQEAAVSWDGRDPGAVLPEHLIEVIARFTRLVRESPAADARSGVSARFAIAAAESAAAAAVRRSALTASVPAGGKGAPQGAAVQGQGAGKQPEPPVTRVCDLPGAVTTLRGKVEFEVSEEGREEEILAHLLRRAVADTFRARLGSADLSGLLAKFADGGTVESGELVSAAELLRRTGEVPGLAKIMGRLGMEGGESFGEAAAAIEFTLEGLYLMRRLSKDTAEGISVYRI